MRSLGVHHKFVLTLIALLGVMIITSAAAPTPAATAYYAFGDDLLSIGVDGSGAAVVNDGPGDGMTTYIVDVDFDPAANLLFWVERSLFFDDTLKVKDFNSGTVSTVATAREITGLDTDPVNQTVYFTDAGVDLINAIALNRVYRVDYPTVSANAPVPVYDAGGTTIVYDVAVNPATGQIFITQTPILGDPIQSAIIVAGLDGSNPQTLLDSTDGLLGIAAMMDVDVINNRLYWTNGYQIQAANTDGSGFGTVYTSSQQPVGIAVDPAAGLLYYNEGDQDGNISLKKIGTDGSTPTLITAVGNTAFPSGVTTDSDQKLSDTTSNATVTLGFASATSSAFENAGSAVDVTLTVTDDAVTGTFSAALSSNGSGTDTASLNDDYTIPATVTFDCTAGCPAGTTLTDTVVTLVDDTFDEGDETVTLALSTLSGPLTVTAGTLAHTLTISEDDAAALVVTPPNTLSISEQGGDSIDFSVRLATQPISNISLTINTSDSSEGTLSTNNMTFTPGNWSVDQTVTVIAQDDASMDGDQVFDLSFTVVSGDAAYTALDPVVYQITNVDNESLAQFLIVNPDSYNATIGDPLTVTPTTGVLANDIGDGTLTATLVSQPVQGTLTFNPNGSFTYTPVITASGTDSFTYTATDNNTTSAPVTVTLNLTLPTDDVIRLYPADGESLTTGPEWPRFSFRHQPGVEWYRVWIGKADGSSVLLDYTWYASSINSTDASAANVICADGLCTLPLDLWPTNGTYEWWITTWSADDTDFASKWTQTTFTVNFPPVSGNVDRVNPATTLNSTPSTLQWAYDPGALYYRLWVGTVDPQEAVIFAWFPAPSLCTATLCTLDASFYDFPAGDYQWFVQVWGPAGMSTWADNGNYLFSLP